MELHKSTYIKKLYTFVYIVVRIGGASLGDSSKKRRPPMEQLWN